jgi:hypothetical protein
VSIKELVHFREERFVAWFDKGNVQPYPPFSDERIIQTWGALFTVYRRN